MVTYKGRGTNLPYFFQFFVSLCYFRLGEISINQSINQSVHQSLQLSLHKFEKFSVLTETPKFQGVLQQQGGSDAIPDWFINPIQSSASAVHIPTWGYVCALVQGLEWPSRCWDGRPAVTLSWRNKKQNVLYIFFNASTCTCSCQYFWSLILASECIYLCAHRYACTCIYMYRHLKWVQEWRRDHGIIGL